MFSIINYEGSKEKVNDIKKYSSNVIYSKVKGIIIWLKYIDNTYFIENSIIYMVNFMHEKYNSSIYYYFKQNNLFFPWRSR